MIKRIYFLISIIQADRLNHKSKKDRFFRQNGIFRKGPVRFRYLDLGPGKLAN